MKRHELKTWPEFYRAIESGDKTFELRVDDRAFAVGDVLVLYECPAKGYPTGRVVEREVTYVMSGPLFGLMAGWVCMGLRPADHMPSSR